MNQGSNEKARPCPFHSESLSTVVDGEIHNIHCEHCGDYRISDTALAVLEFRVRSHPDAKDTLSGWRSLLRRKPLVSTRDIRMFAS